MTLHGSIDRNNVRESLSACAQTQQEKKNRVVEIPAQLRSQLSIWMQWTLPYAALIQSSEIIAPPLLAIFQKIKWRVAESWPLSPPCLSGCWVSTCWVRNTLPRAQTTSQEEAASRALGWSAHPALRGQTTCSETLFATFWSARFINMLKKKKKKKFKRSQSHSNLQEKHIYIFAFTSAHFVVLFVCSLRANILAWEGTKETGTPILSSLEQRTHGST